MSDPTVLAKIARAEQAVDDLCQGRLRWEMRVPAEPDHDPDLIISEALRAAREAIAAQKTPPADPESRWYADGDMIAWNDFDESHCIGLAATPKDAEDIVAAHLAAGVRVPADHPEWIDLAADIRDEGELRAGALASALTARGWTRRAAGVRVPGEAGLREAAQAVVRAWDHGHGEPGTHLLLPTEAEMDALRSSLATASDTIDRQGWSIDEAQELLRDALHALENCIDPKNRSHVSVTIGALRAALAASPSTPPETLAQKVDREFR